MADPCDQCVRLPVPFDDPSDCKCSVQAITCYSETARYEPKGQSPDERQHNSLRTCHVARVRAVAAVASMLLGLVAIFVGAFLAFPLVISVLLYPVGLRPNSFAAIAMIGALVSEIIGLGLIFMGPRMWPRAGRRAKD